MWNTYYTTNIEVLLVSATGQCFVAGAVQVHTWSISAVVLAFLLLTTIFRMSIIILTLTFTTCFYERVDEKQESTWRLQPVSDWLGQTAVKQFVTNSGVTILTAAVMHSQALKEIKLNLWLAVQKSGWVICAHCVYMAR